MPDTIENGATPETDTQHQDPQADTLEQHPSDEGQPGQTGDFETRYKELQGAFTKASQEAATAKAKAAQLEGQISQIQTPLSDPTYVEKLARALRAANGVDQPAQSNDFATIATKHGLGEDLAKAMDGFLRDAGYVRRDDPEITQALGSLGALVQQRHTDAWGQIEQKYADVSQHKQAVEALISRSGGALDMEQALAAVTRGRLTPRTATKEVEVTRNATAPKPRPTQQPGTRPATSAKYDMTKDGAAKAFSDAAKELNLDLSKLFPAMRL